MLDWKYEPIKSAKILCRKLIVFVGFIKYGVVDRPHVAYLCDTTVQGEHVTKKANLHDENHEKINLIDEMCPRFCKLIFVLFTFLYEWWFLSHLKKNETKPRFSSVCHVSAEGHLINRPCNIEEWMHSPSRKDKSTEKKDLRRVDKKEMGRIWLILLCQRLHLLFSRNS